MKRHLKRPSKVKKHDYRIFVVINYLTLLGTVFHASLIPIFYLIGNDVLAVVNIFSTLAWHTARSSNRNGFYTRAIAILCTEVVVHTILTLYYFGWEIGFQYYLIAGIPFLMFYQRIKLVPLLFLSGFACSLFIGLYALTANHDYQHDYPHVIAILNYANILASFAALTITSYYFRVASFISEQKMEILANTDMLTGLSNRRGIYPLLNAQHEHFLRNGTDFCVVLADIDNFKNINDQYGHDCGDYILRKISHLLKSRLRKYDVVGRWGGEEFLFMFPGCRSKDAAVVAEDIRNTVEHHDFIFKKQTINLTVTLGVTAHKEGCSINDTIKLADDALYQGKNGGRNRVVENI